LVDGIGQAQLVINYVLSPRRATLGSIDLPSRLLNRMAVDSILRVLRVNERLGGSPARCLTASCSSSCRWRYCWQLSDKMWGHLAMPAAQL